MCQELKKGNSIAVGDLKEQFAKDNRDVGSLLCKIKVICLLFFSNIVLSAIVSAYG